MNLLLRCLAALALVMSFTACGTSRSEFTPQGGPPTVGMPAELSERERNYIPQLDTALRDRGYLPVRHGAGDFQLEFKIAEGPIHADTTIGLFEDERQVAGGRGRGAGAPMIGRDKVADRSFQRAFDEFQSSLSGSAPAAPDDNAPAGAGDDGLYVY
ncbi:hypothetical protein [Luteolibacter marinus]|uniref:hypothetical protein n=1 Tax=Luteolibacter marinus TaxID=2776705 RepID=UPI0018673F47|nr:hypothetical protein [Luteolibacter marinus]